MPLSAQMNYDAQALRRADLDHCIHPWPDFEDGPQTGATIMVRGEGAHVWDAEGRKFIDGIGGLWFANVGFGRQELTDAAGRTAHYYAPALGEGIEDGAKAGLGAVPSTPGGCL